MSILAARGTLNNDGIWSTNASDTVGTVNNTGRLNISGSNGSSTTSQTTIKGDLSNPGIIQPTVDLYNKNGSVLVEDGTLTVNSGSSISDGYTEQGAGALDLHVMPEHSNILGASPMAEASTRFDFGKNTTLQVFGGVGGTFCSQDSLGANMQFADALGPIYFHQTSTLPQDRLKSTAGIDLKAGEHRDMRLEYSSEFADDFESDTGALKFTYKF